MKNFIVKASLLNYIDLNRVQRALAKNGINKSKIDYVMKKFKKDESLQFENFKKGPILAMKLFPFGVIFGAILYSIGLFSAEAPPFALYDLFFLMLVSAFVFLIFGFFVGNRSHAHLLLYKKSAPNQKVILAIDANDHLEAEQISKMIKNRCPDASVTINDLSVEIESGLRRQE